jgi:hypothetical protein
MTAATARRLRGKSPDDWLTIPGLSSRAVVTHACDLKALRSNNWTEFATRRHKSLSEKLRGVFLGTYR